MTKNFRRIWQLVINLRIFSYQHILLLQLCTYLFCAIVILPKVFSTSGSYFESPKNVQNDSFHDFFDTCYWTIRKEETYSVWRSIYPPFAHLWCKILYLGYDTSLTLGTPILQWRTSILVLPLLAQICLYIFSLWLLIVSRLRQSTAAKNNLLPLVILVSLVLSVPSFFLIQSGNILALSVVLLNLSLCPMPYLYTWKQFTPLLQAILISLAAAIKPQLIVFMIQLRKVNLYLLSIFIFVSINIIALLIWQPASPEKIFKNLSGFVKANDYLLVTLNVSDSFAINSYRILIKLTNVFVSNPDRKYLIAFFWSSIIICIVLLSINTYLTFRSCRIFLRCQHHDYYELAIYALCTYLLNTVYGFADGKYMAFFLPLFVVFVAKFPRCKFNILEFIFTFYTFFSLFFLPDSMFRLSNHFPVLMEFYHIPSQFNYASFTIDNLIRPLAMQVFYLLFICRIWHEFCALKQQSYPELNSAMRNAKTF